MPAGHNASVAIMSYSGYDIEDAIILNKGSLDRGFGRIIYARRNTAELMKYANADDRIVGPVYMEDKKKTNVQKILKKHRALDTDGIARVGERIHNGEVYVNKEVPVSGNNTYAQKREDIQYYPTPSVYKSGNPSTVDKVWLTTNEGAHMLIKTILTQVRIPELGDKFSSRHGQKGVLGLMVPEVFFFKLKIK